jgi:N-acylneuraminate cytidylyltransferase
MLAWAISICIESKVFDRIVVSTDDDDVAMIARQAGAEAPFVRPSALADDHTPISKVMSHALRELGFDSTTVPAACCVYPTAALLEPQALRLAANKLEESAADYVFGAIRCPANVARAFTTSEAGTSLLSPGLVNTRTQDLPAVFIDAGQFCMGQGSAWLDEAPVLGGASQVLELDPSCVVDIDTLEDWTQAEARARQLPRFSHQ